MSRTFQIQATTLIDQLGAWPLYLFVMQALAPLVLYPLLSLPFKKRTAAS